MSMVLFTRSWFRDAVEKVKQITKEIDDGRFTFKRFLAEESSGCKEILGQAIWLLSWRSVSYRYTPERVDQEGNGKNQQEKVLINWDEACILTSNKYPFSLNKYRFSVKGEDNWKWQLFLCKSSFIWKNLRIAFSFLSFPFWSISVH